MTIALFFVKSVDFLFALLHLKQGRLSQIELAFFDQIPHIAKKEGHDQSADMATVDIGIGHDNDLAIAQFLEIVVLTETGAQCGNQREQLIIA